MQMSQANRAGGAELCKRAGTDREHTNVSRNVEASELSRGFLAYLWTSGIGSAIIKTASICLHENHSRRQMLGGLTRVVTNEPYISVCCHFVRGWLCLCYARDYVIRHSFAEEANA